jgi:hypothetical protein
MLTSIRSHSRPDARSDELHGKISIYAPDFKGATPVEDAIPIIRSTWEKASIEDGYGGAFVSHHGTKQWL